MNWFECLTVIEKRGIGVGQLITGVYVAFYYPTLMTWAFAFGVMGIGKWNTCELAANLTRCSVILFQNKPIY